MRIDCPHCGLRDSSEFTYLGDASPRRPRTDEGSIGVDPPDPTSLAAFQDYVYIRDNIAGTMREHWYHGGGCRAWLVVTRDTTTHAISAVAAARDGTGPADEKPAVARPGGAA